MTSAAEHRKTRPSEADAILNALPNPVVLIGPDGKIVEANNGSVTYLNSGDWVEHLTALEYCQSEWSIFEYNEKDFPVTQTIEMKSSINVLTDEINFYINSLEAI